MRTNKIINYHDITSNSHKQQTRKGVVTSCSFKRICPQITVVTCLPMKALIKDSPFRQQDLGEMTFHLHGVCLLKATDLTPFCCLYYRASPTNRWFIGLQFEKKGKYYLFIRVYYQLFTFTCNRAVKKITKKSFTKWKFNLCYFVVLTENVNVDLTGAIQMFTNTGM